MRLFIDADLPYRLDVLDIMIDMLASGQADVTVGSRALAESRYAIEPTFTRRLASHVFTFLVSEIITRGVIDTQCGVKGFTASAAEFLFSRSIIDGFAADVEIIALALRADLRIKTLPVELVDDSHSTIQMYRHASRMLRDLMRIGWRLEREVLPPYDATVDE